MNAPQHNPITRNPVSVAHSPDSDDIVQFLGITSGLIENGGFDFRISRLDTAELNRRAAAGDFDVIAISTAAYPAIAEEYLILPHGASIGRNYGPVVAARKQLDHSELNRLKIGIPGTTTTAAAVLRLVAPLAETVVVPIAPFEKIFEALDSGQIDAAVLIHEGQILYEQFGLVPVLNLGQWWHEKMGAPLPLGLNVIRRSLGPERIKSISDVIRRSIDKGVNDRDWAIEMLLSSGDLNGAPMTRDSLRRYLEMYANGDTLDLDQDCRNSIVKLVAAIDPDCRIEFAP